MSPTGQYRVPTRPSHFWQQEYRHPMRMIGPSWYIWCNKSEARAHFCWLSVPTEVEFLNGGWMHCLQSLLIYKDIPEEALSLGSRFPIVSSTKQKLNTKSPRRQKSWSLMTSCHQYSRLGILLQRKAKMSKIIVYIRTIKIIFLQKRVGRLQVASLQSISIFGIYVLLIESIMVKCQ